MTAPNGIAERFARKFIVLDGLDGCGKSTQLDKLVTFLTDNDVPVVAARDPGGTAVGDRIRHILLGYDLSQMDVRCEAFLFMASRAQLVSEVIEPAIADGDAVLCSRFISSTYAYQGAAGYDVSRLLDLGNWAVGDVWPDLTIVLDVPVEVGFERTGRKSHHAGANRSASTGDQGELFLDATVDAMEAKSIDFHRRVREAFLSLPDRYPKPVHIVDASGSEDEVHRDILKLIGRVDF